VLAITDTAADAAERLKLPIRQLDEIVGVSVTRRLVFQATVRAAT
jgi:hypothetical protein